jgi:hypothetical protein
MAGKTSKKSAKVAKNAAAKRVAAKAAKPHSAVANSSARKPTKERPVPRKDSSSTPNSASQMIDQRIRDLGDWRGSVLKRMRAHPRGGPRGRRGVVVKLTFFHGASLKDPARLFNSSLEGNTRRAIDIHKDDVIEDAAFKELIRAANVAKRKK